MRVNIFLVLISSLFLLFLWVIASGVSFFLGSVFFVLFLLVTVAFPDTLTLFFLGARELKSNESRSFFEASSQEAYKLSVPMPDLYFYNGNLERAFVLQNGSRVSLILNQAILEKCTTSELSAICFELLLQVKKGLARKRTKVMYILGLISWVVHSFTSIFTFILPWVETRRAIDGFLNFLLYPWLNFLFAILLGEGYFKKLHMILKDFPLEHGLLSRVGLKFRKPSSYQSLPSRKVMEIACLSQSRQLQNIMALEFLPHEWDQVFAQTEKISAE